MVDENRVGNGDQKQDCEQGAEVDEAGATVSVRLDEVGGDADQGGGEDAGAEPPELPPAR